MSNEPILGPGKRSLATMFIRVVSLTFYTIAFCNVTSMLRAQSTVEILARLDHSAHSFTGARATIRVVTHTGIINEDEAQVGTIVVKRSSPKDQRFLISFTAPDAQAVAFRDGTIQIYYPKLNTIQEYDIGKYKDLAQKLILLGFGMRGSELAANYGVSNLGHEQIESQDSVHLELIPKAQEVLQKLSRVDLWISLNTNCPVQQKFYMPSGDYRLVTYSNFQVNPPHLPDSELKLPKTATRQRMN